jgi:thiamine phosphate synthase YjbQ (UPF0047 family)
MLRRIVKRKGSRLRLVDGTHMVASWQGIYLFEHRRAPHTRQVVVTLMGS